MLNANTKYSSSDKNKKIFVTRLIDSFLKIRRIIFVTIGF